MAWSVFLGTWAFYLGLSWSQWKWAIRYEKEHGRPLIVERGEEMAALSAG